MSDPDEYAAFLEAEVAKTKTGHCPNCNAALRPLHCCVCEGCDGCREHAASPSDAEQLMELRRALLSIERAAPACECEHNNEYCCAVVGEFCAMCWAHAALNPSHLPKETQ